MTNSDVTRPNEDYRSLGGTRIVLSAAPRMAGDAPDGMELDARRRLVDHQGQDDARRPAAHRGCGARRSD